MLLKYKQVPPSVSILLQKEQKIEGIFDEYKSGSSILLTAEIHLPTNDRPLMNYSPQNNNSNTSIILDSQQSNASDVEDVYNSSINALDPLTFRNTMSQNSSTVVVVQKNISQITTQMTENSCIFQEESISVIIDNLLEANSQIGTPTKANEVSGLLTEDEEEEEEEVLCIPDSLPLMSDMEKIGLEFKKRGVGPLKLVPVHTTTKDTQPLASFPLDHQIQDDDEDLILFLKGMEDHYEEVIEEDIFKDSSELSEVIFSQKPQDRIPVPQSIPQSPSPKNRSSTSISPSSRNTETVKKPKAKKNVRILSTNDSISSHPNKTIEKKRGSRTGSSNSTITKKKDIQPFLSLSSKNSIKTDRKTRNSKLTNDTHLPGTGLTAGAYVWALWKNDVDDYYYPATIVEKKPQNRKSKKDFDEDVFLVKYVAGKEALVEVGAMQLLKANMKGYPVLLPGKGCSPWEFGEIIEVLEENKRYNVRFGKNQLVRTVNLRNLFINGKIFEALKEKDVKNIDNEFSFNVGEFMGPILHSGNTQIFKNVGFLMTFPSFEDNEKDVDFSNFSKPYLINQIENLGGTIVFSITDPRIESFGSKKSNYLVEKIIDENEDAEDDFELVVLISTRPCRTMKYLYCLGRGIPILSFSWIKNCCLKNQRIDYKLFRLSNGWSDDFSHYALVPHISNGVFNNLKFHILSKKTEFRTQWTSMICAGNGSIFGTEVKSTTAKKRSDRNKKRRLDSSTIVSCNDVHFVVVDDGGLSKENVRKLCCSDEFADSVFVSSSFVVQCLVNQRIVDSKLYEIN